MKSVFVEGLETRIVASATSSPLVAVALAPVHDHAVSHQPLITRLLDVPPRMQWEEYNGFCGETCVQESALYNGAYISQYKIRAITSHNEHHDLIIDGGLKTTLNDLRLRFDVWRSSGKPYPQNEAFLGWTKRQIARGYPVIAAAFINSDSDPYYDHIIPLIGFQSKYDLTTYHPDDQLIYTDDFTNQIYTRSFSSVVATREEANAGSDSYYLPRIADYAFSVKGIVDPKHETVPVRMAVDRSDEPDPFAGGAPVRMHATLTLSNLVQGKTYKLLRYDDYRRVPASDFLSRGGYKSALTFRATSSTMVFHDQFLSNSSQIYRCVVATTFKA